MSAHEAAVERFKAMLAEQSDESIAAFSDLLADDVRVVGMMAAGADKDTVTKGLANNLMAPMFGAAQWSEPEVDGRTITLVAKLPAGAPLAGMLFEITTDDSGKVTEILEEMQPALPPAPSPLKLTDELKDQIRGAFDHERMAAAVVTYVDDAGVPHQGYRGTLQPYSDDQLAVWNRDRAGGMTKAIATNPNVAVFFRSTTNGMIYQFTGRARIDESANDTVYENSPVAEQNADPRRRGVAVIIDLDRVAGIGYAGRFTMERGA